MVGLGGGMVSAVSFPGVAMWLCATIAVPLGWRFTSRRALRQDAAAPTPAD